MNWAYCSPIRYFPEPDWLVSWISFDETQARHPLCALSDSNHVFLATGDRWHNRNFGPGRNSRGKSAGVTYVLVAHKDIHVPSSFARFG